MSINYHAFANRGFLFDTYPENARLFRERFSSFSPEKIARILSLPFDGQYLHIRYLQRDYRLRLSDGVLEKRLLPGEEESPLPASLSLEDLPRGSGEGYTVRTLFNESMSIYHLLTYTKEEPALSGVFVPNESLDPRSKSRISDPIAKHFAAVFSGRTDALIAAGRALNGQIFDRGDASFTFYPFPVTPIRLIFWDADEEFDAGVQILTDQRVTDYVHFETTGCLVSDLTERLEALADRRPAGFGADPSA